MVLWLHAHTFSAANKTAAQVGEKQDGCEPLDRVERAPPVSPKAVNASEEFLGQRDDDPRRASHVAESVPVLVLGHFADEFGAVSAQASDSVVDDDADVVQSLERHMPRSSKGRARWSRPTGSREAM